MAGDSLLEEEMMESGDEFEAAYRLHAGPIHNFFLWRTRDTALAEDLTGEVFEKAWRSRASFRGGSRRAWLQRIARNLLIDHWRRQKLIYSDNVEGLAEAEVSPDASTTVDQALMVERMQRAVDRLPAIMQQVVRLRFVEGLPARQVGQRLQLTESNVRVIQYRALRKLKEDLNE